MNDFETFVNESAVGGLSTVSNVCWISVGSIAALVALYFLIKELFRAYKQFISDNEWFTRTPKDFR